MRTLSGLFALFIVAPALAQPAADPPPPPSAVDDEPIMTADEAPAQMQTGQVEIGVHLFGMAQGSFIDELDEDKKIIEVEGRRVKAVYPGFGGVSGGGGLAVDALWRGVVGLQLGLFFSNDEGEGSINDVDFTIGQTAVHLPVLLKVAAPVPSVRPFAFFGPEFVFPGDPEVGGDLPPGIEVKAEADTYMALAFGLGFEFMIPNDTIDIRIPFTLRGAWNPSVEEDIQKRASFEVENGNVLRSVTFKSEWQWQAGAMLGVAFYFHPKG